MTLKVEGTLLGSENSDDYPYADPSKVNKASSLINTNSAGLKLEGTTTIDKKNFIKIPIKFVTTYNFLRLQLFY
jgi:hypothetical protein